MPNFERFNGYSEEEHPELENSQLKIQPDEITEESNEIEVATNTEIDQTIGKDQLDAKIQKIRNIFQEISIEVPGENPVTFTEEEIDRIVKFHGIRYFPESSEEVIPERFKKNLLLLNISADDWKKTALMQPSLFYQKPETISGKVEETIGLLGVEDRASYIKAALKQPSLFLRYPERINKDIEDAMNLIGVVDKAQYVKAALKQTSMFSRSPETINNNIEKAMELLGIEDKSQYIKTALMRPSLFILSPETVSNNINGAVQLLGIEDKSQYIKAALERPGLFGQSPETINRNIEKAAKLLGIENKERYVKAALKKPSLFYQSPETVSNNINGAVQLLGIEDRNQYVEAALKSPSLFPRSPETINKNIEEAAKLLGIEDKNQYVEVALKFPPLFTLKSETVYGNFKSLSILYNNDLDKTRSAIFKNPNFLCFSQERDFIHWIARQITHKNTNLFRNPQQIIKHYFESKKSDSVNQAETVDIEEGSEKLMRVIGIFEEQSKADRKKS